jgi:hypothetical protein
MLFWLNCYLAAGVLWGLWNAQSRFFKNVMTAADRDGRLWTIFVGFLVGCLLWPIGAITYVIFRLRR